MSRMQNFVAWLLVAIVGSMLVLGGGFSGNAQASELEGTININLQAEIGVQEGWEAVAAAYMQQHPNVKVVVDLKPAEGYAEWLKGILGMADPTADLVHQNLAGPAGTGKFINYLEYVTLDSSYSDGVWMDQFNFEIQGNKDLARDEWANLNLQTVQVLWCYNKDLFAQVGVTPPKSWDELIAVSEKFVEAGIQPLAVPGDFNSFWAMQMGWLAQIYIDQTTRDLLNVFRAHEGDFLYDPDVDGEWEYDPTDPYNDDPWKVNQNVVRAYKAIVDGVYAPDSDGSKAVWTNFAKVFPKYAGGDAFFGTKDALPLFYQGKAAMYVDGAWRIPMFKRDMEKITKGEAVTSGETAIEGIKPFSMGTFNMPSMEGPEFVAPARTIEVALGFIGALKKDKIHDDLVVDFLMYASSKEGNGQYMLAALEAGWAPAGPSTVYDVELPGEYAELFSELEFIGNSQKGFGQYIARGAPKDVQESLRDWYGYSQGFLSGKITIDEWAAKHKENVMKYLPKSMETEGVQESDLQNPQNAPTGK